MAGDRDTGHQGLSQSNIDACLYRCVGRDCPTSAKGLAAQSILGYRVLGIVGGARAVDAFVPGVFADR